MSESNKTKTVAITLRRDQIDQLPPPNKSFAARLEKRTLSAWFQRAVDYYLAAGCPKNNQTDQKMYSARILVLY